MWRDLPRVRRLSLLGALALLGIGACEGAKDDTTAPGGDVGTDAATTIEDASADDATTSAGDATASAGDATASAEAMQTVLDKVRINSRMEQGNFQKVSGPVDFGQGTFDSAKLVIDLDSSCYPFTRWADDPPPMGQHWPAKSDAFDRLFEISLDPPATMDGKPGIELAHAITPFGGPLHFEADITDVANGLHGKHAIEAYIETWPDLGGQSTGSEGGWTVSAHVELHAGPVPREILGIVPLVHTNQTSAIMPPIAFTVPAGATHTRIDYRATGHGGGMGDAACVGPAEEFCKRTHTFTIDGAAAGTFEPWRTDCQMAVCTPVQVLAPGSTTRMLSICAENPCGSVASVQAPRANWCPGSLVPPHPIEGTLAPGDHTIGWTVSALAAGGDWRVSATLFSYR